jgi:Mg-chelatase subunit ChlD
MDAIIPEDALDIIISCIIDRTRSHPDIVRGASSRASLAIKNISLAYQKLHGTLDCSSLQKAAMVALPHRISMNPVSKRQAKEIIAEITSEVLFDVFSFDLLKQLEKERLPKSGEQDDVTGPHGAQSEYPRISSEADKKQFIEELIHFQESQSSREVHLQNLHTHYMDEVRKGKKVDPGKVEYEHLKKILTDLEDEGFVTMLGEGKGYHLEGKALAILLETSRMESPGKSHHAKQEHRIEKVNVRRYMRGDNYRTISMRHTLKMLLKKGKRIKDISPQDLRVFDKVPLSQKDIMLCIDVSDSMKEQEKLLYAKVAALGVARSVIARGERIGIVSFSNYGKISVRPTRRVSEIAEALLNLTAHQYTNIGDGIKKAREILLNRDPGHQKEIIIMSDGLPNISGEGLSTEDFFSPEYSEMNEFRYCIGTPPSPSYTPEDAAAIKYTKSMFKNVLAKDYAAKEARKARERGIKISFLYIGEHESDGHTFARQLSRLGGGTYHAIKKVSCLPQKALELI